jgi:hypothetical protein
MEMQTSKTNLKNPVNSVRNLGRKAMENVANGPAKEGKTTKAVEHVTGKLPSIAWLGFAVASMAASAAILGSSRKKEYANFVGLWAPSFLLIGIYNKLVKLEESSTLDHSRISSGQDFGSSKSIGY